MRIWQLSAMLYEAMRAAKSTGKRACGPCQLIEQHRVVDKCIRRNVSPASRCAGVDNNLQCLVRDGHRPTTRSLTDELSTAKQPDGPRQETHGGRLKGPLMAPLVLYLSSLSHEIWLCPIECLSQLHRLLESLPGR